MARPLPRADVKVGFACNNRCVFCAHGERREVCGAVPLAELIHRLGEVRARTRGLVLTGGEPTVHKHILPIVRAAARLGFEPIQIQTNGRMLSLPRYVESLLAAGASEISPSLHGSTAHLHDALTRAHGSFDETVHGIKNAVACGAPVVTNSVITRASAHDLPSLVGLLATLGVRAMQLAFVHPVGTAATFFDDVVPRFSDIVAPLARARAVARAAGVRLLTDGVPLCFLRGMQELAVDRFGEDGDAKTQGPPCGGCAMRAACDGPFREYPARFGWDEFVPFAPWRTA